MKITDLQPNRLYTKADSRRYFTVFVNAVDEINNQVTIQTVMVDSQQPAVYKRLSQPYVVGLTQMLTRYVPTSTIDCIDDKQRVECSEVTLRSKRTNATGRLIEMNDDFILIEWVTRRGKPLTTPTPSVGHRINLNQFNIELVA